MSDHADDETIIDAVVVSRPPPRWTSWITRILWSVAIVLISISLAATIIYVAPTARRNADAVAKLASATALEKAQDACYDQYTSDVTDGNAATLAASVDSGAALGALVVALARGQREPATVDPLIAQIDAAASHAVVASKQYNAAIKARKDYVAAGRPLPCTNQPN